VTGADCTGIKRLNALCYVKIFAASISSYINGKRNHTGGLNIYTNNILHSFDFLFE
jgi:hypothetical protein